MKDWKIVSLEIEDSDKQIGDVFEHVWPKRTSRKELKSVDDDHMIIREPREICRRIADELNGIDEKIITVYGNGMWHHYTCGLFKAAEGKFGECTYWHFDNHDDWGYGSSNGFGCGSFAKYLVKNSLSHCIRAVGNSLDTDELQRILSQKVNYKSIGPKSSEGIETLIENTPQRNYLSFDLDVMDNTEMNTNYNQGRLKTGKLIEMIRKIKEQKDIISADILGYAEERKGFDAKSLVLYLLIAGEILGEDIRELGKLYYHIKERNVNKKELFKLLK